jgi:energy-coupling factor transport system substrate-specific component
VGWRSAIVMAAASVVGLLLLAWPLLVPAASGSRPGESALTLAALLPVIVLLVLAVMADGGMDAKALAMLGVLAATCAALRPLGAGLGGVEPMLFLLVLAGRVFGAGFGFALGAIGMAASALLTGGVGPWLPSQMMVAAWAGMGAGLLPGRVRGRWEIAWLALYGVVAAYAFGLLMNLWFWPSLAGTATVGTAGQGLAYAPGAPLLDNLRRFALFTTATSTAGWDTVRAVVTALLTVVVGPSVLLLLRRSAHRAGFAEA